MQLPSAGFVPYASALPPGSQLGTSPGYVSHRGTCSQMQWVPAQTTRNSSVEAAPTHVRQYSAELLSGVHRSGAHAGLSPHGPFLAPQMVAPPVSYFGASSLGSAPFSYQQPYLGSRMPNPQVVPLDGIAEPKSTAGYVTAAVAPAAAAPAAAPAAAQAALAGVPAPTSATTPAALTAPSGTTVPIVCELLGQPTSTSSTAVPKSADRSTRRSAMCQQVFQFVDSQRTGYIDMYQNKTGLTLVFEQLGDIPMPKDDWYIKVFRNFSRNSTALLDYEKFHEIVVQWDEHQLQKKKGDMRRSSEALPSPPPKPGMIQGAPISAKSANPVASVDHEYQAPCLPTNSDMSAACLSAAGEKQMAGNQDMLNKSRADAMYGAMANVQDTETVAPCHEGQEDTVTRCGPARNSAAEIVPDVMFPTYIGRLAIFDDYEFIGDVGSGSFGKVMVVRHKHTKQLRACKVVAVQTALQRELIDTEIKLLKSLNHPNIMKMHEVYFEQATEQRIMNGNIYLITELCEGGDLFSRILHHYEKLKQPMTESHVAFMMQQILSATQYCHDRGIIHRDIKPENILFVDRKPSSPLKIIDFGLADFTDKIREQAKEVKIPRGGTLGRLARMLPSVNGKHLISWHERKKVMQKAGTPHYMAPEMIEGCYDQKADLFSIGIILCQLLTGWHPFYVPGDDEQSVRKKITSQEPLQFPQELWAPVSKDAQALCRDLLGRCPKIRPDAAQVLKYPWFRDPDKLSPFGDTKGLSVSIFDGLMKYQAYNKLKRAVLQLLTKELSEFQIQELRNKFMALDSQGDGLLSPEELIEGMKHVGYVMSSSGELEQIMAALDASGSQRIGYKEFISALIERRVKFDRQQLRECFKKFDTNNSGTISYDDVKKIVAGGITESEWQEIASQRSEITFEEFVALMESDGHG